MSALNDLQFFRKEGSLFEGKSKGTEFALNAEGGLGDYGSGKKVGEGLTEMKMVVDAVM